MLGRHSPISQATGRLKNTSNYRDIINVLSSSLAGLDAVLKALLLKEGPSRTFSMRHVGAAKECAELFRPFSQSAFEVNRPVRNALFRNTRRVTKKDRKEENPKSPNK